MNEEFYQKLIEHISDGIYYVDLSKKITFWNKAAERITGYTKQEVMDARCSDNMLRHIDEMGRELCISGCPLSKTIKDGQIRTMDVYLHHKDGHRVPVTVRAAPIPDKDGKTVGVVETFSDNSRRIDIIQELSKLRKEAFADPLTGIGNRRFAEITIKNKIQELQSFYLPFGILFVDIDHFKQCNDTYGHNTGDRVLIMVAKTMSNVLRHLDFVARWGGEEFVVILTNINKDVLGRVAERIRVFIERSWLMVENQKLTVTVSIGGTMAIEKDSIDSLIERADSQMYSSKNSGRNRVSLAS
ncbi:MAG: sensor domain-containing diguanylate cyclase [Leptospiraceae bacterium]|nr:sensor domain-containing diguanylate cyclase [Leptospiraceae bacterium]MCP5493057.1 sensor domain-containing diguanylate cyclase [Leptospiraceae bacterium]